MDSYDWIVAYLTEHPDEILNAWTDPLVHKAGAMFRFVSPTGKQDNVPNTNGLLCGCPTMIRSGFHPRTAQAFTPELTAMIANDEQIPPNIRTLTPADLPHLAEVNRQIDIALNRPSPIFE